MTVNGERRRVSPWRSGVHGKASKQLISHTLQYTLEILDLPIVGHTSTGSTYRPQAKRDLVIGRYIGP